MLGVQDSIIHIWVTPLEIQDLEQRSIKGLIHLSDTESISLEVTLLTEGPELAANMEKEKTGYHVSMSRLYHEQLKEYGKTTIFAVSSGGLDMINVYDARIHAEQFATKLERE